MKWPKRIFLFILTNILVVTTISIALTLIQTFFGIQLHPQEMSGLLVLCFVWGMGGAFISLLLSKFMAKTMMGVELIDPNTTDPRARDLLNMVHNITQRAGLEKMPEVGIYESPDPNAFATGPSRNNALVAVSTGLLACMSRDEVEGVIGHEIAHVANGDMVTMTLIQGIVNAFVMFFARILARLVASQFDERARYGIYIALSIVFDILFGILGSLVVAYFSRLREYRADAGGAEYAGKQKMIAGLRRLQSMFDQVQPDDRALATLKISNRPAGVMALFSTHPPLEERIRRLQEA
jgi:heat shock protein HtpX